MNRNFLTYLSSTILMVSLLGGCDKFKKKIAAPGERESIITFQDNLAPSKEIADRPIILSGILKNNEWTQAFFDPTHSVSNFKANPNAMKLLNTSTDFAVRGNTSVVANSVIIAQDKVFGLTTDNNLIAVDSHDLNKVIWKTDLNKESKVKGLTNGGVAYNNGYIYVTTFLGDVYSIDAKNGKIVWSYDSKFPFSAPPTYSDGRLYVVNLNNEVIALNANNGEFLWRYRNIPENTSIVGSGAIAVKDDVVVVGFTSGEVCALDARTGNVLWMEVLMNSKQCEGDTIFAHVKAAPIIRGNTVFIIGHNNRALLLDLTTGRRIWEVEVGGINTPAMAENAIFVLTNDNSLIALDLASGKVCWRRKLPLYDNERRHVAWSGPVLVGDHLLLTNSIHKGIVVDPKNGLVTRRFDVGHSVTVNPVVADEIVYMLTEKGVILTWK